MSSSNENKILYDSAAQWIKENAEDKSLTDPIKKDFLDFGTLSPEDKAQLITSLDKLLEGNGLPEVITQSLPWLRFDLDALPNDLTLEVGTKLKNESDIRSLGSLSTKMHSLFQPPNLLLDKFLQRVAYGEQDKVEALFTDVYSGNVEKIQEALLHQGTFTDYSGREFHCCAYEYAYWAKDTHMCRMLERYMDDTTKAEMLARIDEIERIDEKNKQPIGLQYQQNGVTHRSAHFDFTPLKAALRAYIDDFNELGKTSQLPHQEFFEVLESSWRNVGIVQRDVPAHVAQEYCRPARSFDRCPSFDEPTLLRSLAFYNFITSRDESWFPLGASDSGLGFNFALVRTNRGAFGSAWAAAKYHIAVYEEEGTAERDLAAITRLDEVRTSDLKISREHLCPPELSQNQLNYKEIAM
jgi:hypothetical protein